jgi:putative ABC transport system permease protein
MLVPLSYNVRSLFVRRATTIATAFGIALVVFVLASSLMLSNGIKRTLVSTGAPDRAMVLRKGADTELASNIENRAVGVILSTSGVRMQGQTPLGTSEVVVVLSMEKAGSDGLVSTVQVRGVTPMSHELRKELRIIDGRAAAPGTDEVVIGKGLIGRFSGLEMGKSFELKKNRPVTVVGVFDANGSAFDSEIWADIDTLRGTFGRNGVTSSVLVQLESPAAYDGFKAVVEHDKQLGLESFRENEYYEKQSEGTSIFVTAMGIIVTFFFSLGAMIGATITMYAAVAQRRREIGTLQALGFSRFAILLSFLFESTVLALIGGAVGAIASLAMGFVKLSMMNFATFQEITFTFQPSLGVVLLSTFVGAFMGIVGGFFPALSAARTPPVAAMRG